MPRQYDSFPSIITLKQLVNVSLPEGARMSNGLVSVNGKVSSPEAAQISVFDRGFLFGDDIFEVCVAYKGRILGLKEHLARLRRSAEYIHLPLPWSDKELAEELHDILAQVNAEKCYLRLMITRGQGLGLEIAETMKPNKIIMALPAKPFPERFYKEGVALQVVKRESTSRGPQAKTGNYLSGIVAMRSANADQFDDILWSNCDGEITEASTANIFFIGRIGDTLEVVTPHLQSGLLDGITRSFVIKILRENGIEVQEEAVLVDELARFDEAFICSTMRGLFPVRRIDGHQLHTRRSSSLFNRIEKKFWQAVEKELGITF
jgi:branched-chain amino acid aminotransferase